MALPVRRTRATTDAISQVETASVWQNAGSAWLVAGLIRAEDACIVVMFFRLFVAL